MAVRFVVTGRVQGVGFRWFVARAAHAMGIKGYARNLSDGRVEILAEGPDEALTKLEQRIRVGPDHSWVQEVVRTEQPGELNGINDFEIK
jgi:acylphosphatase